MISGTPRLLSSFTKNEVDNAFKTAKYRIRTEWIDIVISPKTKDFGRVLVVTSRKIGNSPKRNKFRRRIKAFFYEEQLFNSPFDFIIIAKKGAVDLPFIQLKDLIISAINSKTSK